MITDFFPRSISNCKENWDPENLMPREPKRLRRDSPSARLPCRPLNSSGTTRDSPILLSNTPSPPPVVTEPFTNPLNKSLKRDSKGCLITGSALLDESKIPSWLRDPHFSSSDSSDDDLLRPVAFSVDKELSTPLKKRVKVMDIDKEEYVIKDGFQEDVLDSNTTNVVNTSTPSGMITPLTNELQKFNFSTSPSSPRLPDHPLKSDEPSDEISNENSLSVVSERQVIMSKELVFDIESPYHKDLELLIFRNGNLSLNSLNEQQKDTINLFTEGQQETVDILLTLPFASFSRRITDTVEYLLMTTNTENMPTSKCLITFWKTLMDTEEVSIKYEITRFIVRYFHHLLSTHPPGQHKLVKEQYCQFLEAIKSSFLELLQSNEKWKIDLLSVLVSVLVSDFWSFSNQHENVAISFPIFHCLFWKSNESHFVNQTIRNLIQLAIDVYKQEQSYIQERKLEVISQLFYLIYTECQELSRELSCSLSSLSLSQLFICLINLSPVKLQQTVASTVSISEPISISQSCDLIKLSIMLNSFNHKTLKS